MKLKPLLLLPLVLLALTTGCERKNSNTASKQVLRLNLAEDPVSLDPRVVRSLKDLTVVKQLFEGLMRIDESETPQLAIAKRVEVSDDCLIYTFHLREAYWSNRQPVTAHDFEYAWCKVLDPNFGSDYSYMLYPIKNAQLAREGKCSTGAVGVVALDDRTLVVQLEAPTPYFLELVAFPTYFPVNHRLDMSQEEWSLPPGDHFVCNGPFRLQKWKPQAELILKRNPTYWDCSSVQLDRLTFSIIGNNNTESYMFEKEELDWLGQPISNNIATELIGKMKEQGLLDFYSIAGTYWLKYNVDKQPFDQQKIRKAFSYAINRQDIITHILQGNQTLATGPLPPSMDLKPSPYFEDGNTKLAKRLFEEALAENGWTRKTFPKVVLSHYPSERHTKIVQLVQQQWKEAFGITAELESVENQLYRRRVKEGLYQVGTGEWIADFNDPLAFLELFKYRLDSETGNGMNDTGWENATFISLLDRSLTESDPIVRSQLLKQAEEILVQGMPIAPIYHYSFDYVKKPYVQGVVLSPLGTADFKKAQVTR